MSESSLRSALDGVRIYDSKRRLQTQTENIDKVYSLPEQTQQRTLLADEYTHHYNSDSSPNPNSNNDSSNKCSNIRACATDLSSTLKDVECILVSIEEQIDLCNKRNLFRLQDARQQCSTGATQKWLKSEANHLSVLQLDYYDDNRASSELSSAYSSARGNKSTANSDTYLSNSSDNHIGKHRSSSDLRRDSVIDNEGQRLFSELNECYRKFCALEASQRESCDKQKDFSLLYDTNSATKQSDESKRVHLIGAKHNSNHRLDDSAIQSLGKEGNRLFIDKCNIGNAKQVRDSHRFRQRQTSKDPSKNIETEPRSYLSNSRGQNKQQVCRAEQIYVSDCERFLSSSSSLPSALNALCSDELPISSHAINIDGACGRVCKCYTRSLESGSFDVESFVSSSIDLLNRAQLIDNDYESNSETNSVSDDYNEDDYCKAFEFETSNALESVKTDSPSLVDEDEDAYDCARDYLYIDGYRLSVRRESSKASKFSCSEQSSSNSQQIELDESNTATTAVEDSSLSLSWSLDYDFNLNSLRSNASDNYSNTAAQSTGESSQLRNKTNHKFASDSTQPIEIQRSDSVSHANKSNKNANRNLISTSALYGPNYKDYWCTLVTDRQLDCGRDLKVTGPKAEQNQRLLRSLGCARGARSKSTSSLHKMGPKNANGNVLNEQNATQNGFESQKALRGQAKAAQVGRANKSDISATKSLPEAASLATQSKLESAEKDSSIAAQTADEKPKSSQADRTSEIRRRFLRDSIDDDATANSMKTLRDVTKLSIPSLSSLQYLPAKTDVKSNMNAYLNNLCDSNAQDSTTQKVNPKEQTQTRLQRQRSDLAENEPLTSVGGRRRAASESKSDVSRKQSCLLHRICLCTCLARNQTLAHARSTQMLKAPANYTERGAQRISNEEDTGKAAVGVARKKSKLKHLSSCATSSASDELEADLVARANRRTKQNEKQSPSFMNLFRAPTPDSNYVPDRTTDIDAPNTYTQSSAKLRQHSKKSESVVSSQDEATESCARPKAGISGDNNDEQVHLQPETRRRSRSYGNEAVENILQPNLRQQLPSKRTHERSILASYKNLFGGSKESALERQAEKEQIEEERRGHKSVRPAKRDTVTCEGTSEPRGSSFLPKSLHRFSGRSLSRLYNRKKNVCSDSSLQSTCLTPDLSVEVPPPSITLSASSIQDNTSADLHNNYLIGSTSPDTGYSGPNSLLLSHANAPELVSHGDCSMSPQCCRHYHQRCSYQKQTAYRSPSDFRSKVGSIHSSQKQRNACYLSESGSVDDVSGFDGSFQGNQWSSLPTSPQMRRRSRRSPTPSSSSSNYGRRSPRLSSSPVPFSSPPTESTKIEDGLKVCSIEHFEKHIEDVKSYQIEAQKRLFTAWINHFCPNLIRRDLIEELQDGIKLIGLLATLAGDQKLMNQYEKLIKDKQSYVNRLMVTPSSRLKHLSTVSISIDYLKKQLGMKLVNLNPMDIVSGKANVILGLCWNIILNFQIERNLPKYANSSDNSSQLSQDSTSTSRLSKSKTNEDSANSINNIVRSVGDLEEYSQKDLLYARNRLLGYINRRFNLKLTNLTSNFIDGDVLKAILKQTLPNLNETCFQDCRKWDAMSEDEKLELCFSIAEENLNVPKLINPSDLRRQIVVENNSKPMLVYLSMLLESNLNHSHANNTSQSDSFLCDNNDTSTCNSCSSQPVDNDLVSDNIEISELLSKVDVANRYDVEKLQSTLSQLKSLEQAVGRASSEGAKLDKEVLDRSSLLIEEAKQVEALIEWINQADELFETTQRSSADLAKAIENYRHFFSPANVPKLPELAHCPTLERQYQECLATAKQRILSMEQTMKNWISYEKVRQDLRQWLLEAESKLANALRPNIASDSAEQKTSGEGAIEKYQRCLDDLVDYFELEPVDLNDGCDIDQSAFANRVANRSLSSSLASLGSTSSQTSTLTTSRSATHHRLFDSFELKCRLLAAMLDSDQKDALLLGVKELRSRLKYIVEWKVPQVVGELKFNINQCSMSISEQDEVQEASKSDDLETGIIDSTVPLPQGIAAQKVAREDVANEMCANIPEQTPRELSQEPRSNSSVSQAKFAKKSSKAKRKADNSQTTKSQTGKQTSAGKSESASPSAKSESKPTTQSKSLLDWIWPRKSELIATVGNVSHQSVKTKMSKLVNGKPNKAHRTKPKGTISSTTKCSMDDSNEDATDEDSSLAHKLWAKVVRASKVSLPFNIVLLICLAGLCVLPLLNKDACCELSQNLIPPERMTITQRPT